MAIDATVKVEVFPFSNPKDYKSPEDYTRKELERVIEWIYRYLETQTQSGETAGTASGSDTQVQFNDSGNFAGDAELTWNKTTNTLTVGGDITITGTVDGVDVSDLSASVTTNTSNIATNTSNISTNTSDISELQAHSRTRVTKTNDYTVDADDYLIIADATSNTVTISLPLAPVTTRGVFKIKCIDDSFACDVDGNGNNIDGSGSNFQIYKDEVLTLLYDAVKGWLIV